MAQRQRPLGFRAMFARCQLQTHFVLRISAKHMEILVFGFWLKPIRAPVFQVKKHKHALFRHVLQHLPCSHSLWVAVFLKAGED